MKKIVVKAPQGKVIVRMIEVPKKQLSATDIHVNKTWSVDKPIEFELVKRLYDNQPSQAIVIDNGEAIQLREGKEYNELEYGDLIILGTGNFERMLWEGIEYLVIRTSMINGIIKKDDPMYPVYAYNQREGISAHVESTIIN